MKPTENIKRLIKNTKIKTNPAVNEAVLTNLLGVLDKSKGTQASVRKIVIKSRMAKLAAAAAIVIAVSFFFTHNSRNGQIEIPKIAETSESKSPAELTSLISLNSAFRRGGMEAVEKQLAETEKKITRGSKEHITVEQLLCELNECEGI